MTKGGSKKMRAVRSHRRRRRARRKRSRRSWRRSKAATRRSSTLTPSPAPSTSSPWSRARRSTPSGRLVTDEIGSIDGVTRTTTCLPWRSAEMPVLVRAAGLAQTYEWYVREGLDPATSTCRRRTRGSGDPPDVLVYHADRRYAELVPRPEARSERAGRRHAQRGCRSHRRRRDPLRMEVPVAALREGRPAQVAPGDGRGSTGRWCRSCRRCAVTARPACSGRGCRVRRRLVLVVTQRMSSTATPSASAAGSTTCSRTGSPARP